LIEIKLLRGEAAPVSLARKSRNPSRQPPGAGVAEMAAGLIDADLGCHVFKQRVAVPGRGKSGSARVLVGTNLWNRWFFVYGFEKRHRANIDDRELRAIQKMAVTLLKFDAQALTEAERRGELTEICHEKEKPHS
jgi:hypothetical protein